MKNILRLPIITFVITFSLGCSHVIQSKDVINSMHTRFDLLNQLGEPNEKNKHPGVEEWVYYRDTIETYDRRVTIDSSSKIMHQTTGADSTVKPIKLHNADIRFLIDTNNIVVGHKNNGADLTKKVPLSFGQSVLEVLAGTAAVIIIIAVEVVNNKLDM